MAKTNIGTTPASPHPPATTGNVKISFWKYVWQKRRVAFFGSLILVWAWYLDTFPIEELKKADLNYREKIKEFDADLANNNILVNHETVLYSNLNNVATIKDPNYFTILNRNLFINTGNLIGSCASTLSVGFRMTNNSADIDDDPDTDTVPIVVRFKVYVNDLRDKYNSDSSPKALEGYQPDAEKRLEEATRALEKYLPDFRIKRNSIVSKIKENTEKESSFYLYLYAFGTLLVFIDLLLSGWKEYNKA